MVIRRSEPASFRLPPLGGEGRGGGRIGRKTVPRSSAPLPNPPRRGEGTQDVRFRGGNCVTTQERRHPSVGAVGVGDGAADGVGVDLASGADVVFGGGGESGGGAGSSGGADSVSGATALAEERLQRAVAEGVAGEGGGAGAGGGSCSSSMPRGSVRRERRLRTRTARGIARVGRSRGGVTTRSRWSARNVTALRSGC